ncbi:MAG: DUF4926 domain-containing protein [Cyanobacteriota bacterium]
MIELYERVALTRDIPTEGLRKGDVAYLLERIPHPHGGEPGCVLEVFNAIGESLRVVAVCLRRCGEVAVESGSCSH